jgi:hypothetical protein
LREAATVAEPNWMAALYAPVLEELQAAPSREKPRKFKAKRCRREVLGRLDAVGVSPLSARGAIIGPAQIEAAWLATRCMACRLCLDMPPSSVTPLRPTGS